MERGDRYVNRLLKIVPGTSMVAQWLRLCMSITKGVGLTPDRGTRMPHGMAKKLKVKEIIKRPYSLIIMQLVWILMIRRKSEKMHVDYSH